MTKRNWENLSETYIRSFKIRRELVELIQQTGQVDVTRVMMIKMNEKKHYEFKMYHVQA